MPYPPWSHIYSEHLGLGELLLLHIVRHYPIMAALSLALNTAAEGLLSTFVP